MKHSFPYEVDGVDEEERRGWKVDFHFVVVNEEFLKVVDLVG